MKKKTILMIAVIAVVAGGYFFWPRKSAEKAATGPAALNMQRTAVIKRGDLSALVSATGKVEPIHKVEVKSKGSGQIMEMPVEEGDRVQKGSLIARVDETDPRNEYEQAVADLELAKASLTQATSNLQRQEELFKRGLLSQAELDQVKLEEVRAKAQLIKAQTQKTTTEIRLKDSIVRAPISGIILQKNVQAGQIISSGVNSVSGGTLIVTVADMDSVYVYAEVDEVDIGQVKIGQTARVVPDAFADEVFAGTVIRIAPLAKVEQNVTTFNVTVVVPNPQHKLKAGMNATVDMTVADRRNVLLAPKEALKTMPEVRAQLMAMNPADSSAAKRESSFQETSAGGRQRFAGNAIRGANREEVSGNGGMGAGNGALSTKFVLVKMDEKYEQRRVEVGVGNFDFAEIVNGLQEGETVLLFSSSRAAADRQRMMDRMRSMSGFSGFGGAQSQSSGQRTGSGR